MVPFKNYKNWKINLEIKENVIKLLKRHEMPTSSSSTYSCRRNSFVNKPAFCHNYGILSLFGLCQPSPTHFLSYVIMRKMWLLWATKYHSVGVAWQPWGTGWFILNEKQNMKQQGVYCKCVRRKWILFQNKKNKISHNFYIALQ